jgi:lipoyl(octanoyl) transferase
MHPATYPGPCDRRAGALRVRRYGRCSYADGLALQQRAARAVAAGGADELLFVEHAPVITLGRGTTPDQLRATPGELAAAGIALHATDRGGGATYHGPGQIVGYPIVDLRRRGTGVRDYLRALEAALVTALRGAGVDARLRPGLTGVWAPGGKLAAIGVAVRRGITRHGFALNVTTDLAAFERIFPCGLDEPVTSLARLGVGVDAGLLRQRLAGALQDALPPDTGVQPAAPGAPPRTSIASGARA